MRLVADKFAPFRWCTFVKCRTCSSLPANEVAPVLFLLSQEEERLRLGEGIVLNEVLPLANEVLPRSSSCEQRNILFLPQKIHVCSSYCEQQLRSQARRRKKNFVCSLKKNNQQHYNQSIVIQIKLISIQTRFLFLSIVLIPTTWDSY